ncbi:MAG: hypothetical protein OXI24_11610 [Candidatus Poribacteria bacterium]|nr:hypothetical protein [Candidatus Poribacteria bacterium]
MKLLMMLGILMIVFTSCGALTPQETQQERLRLIEAYNEARQRHNPEKIKQAVKDLLVGKWQYVGLEVEGGTVSAKGQESTPQQALKSATDFVQQLSKSATNEQATAPTTPEQVEVPNSPNSATDTQNSERNTPRLPRIEVTDEKPSQEILGAKAALVASTRQNLTLEFFEHRGSYHYTSSNRGKTVTGQCYVTTKRYGDDPFPFISFNRRTGIDLVEFLFGSETVKRIAAKKKQEHAARRREIGTLSARFNKTTSFRVAKAPGITVTEDTLYLVLYGDMKLTPKGWMRTGGLRCTFKRIE